MRLLTPEEAAAAIEQVERARARALAERGTGWAYVGDEMFFIAGRDVPERSYYDDWPLTENGVGSVRQLLEDFEAGLLDVPRFPDARIAIVTGTRMAPIFRGLAPRLEAATGATIEVLGVQNTLFGATVNTAGLLPGRDMVRALRESGPFDIILIPAESLNDDDIFIDDLPFSALADEFAPARVLPGYELTSTLAA